MQVKFKRVLSFAVALVIVAAMLVMGSALHPAVAITPTPTFTASPATVCTTIKVSVQPVTSPTSALTQTLSMSASGGGLFKFTVSVTDPSGNSLGTYSSTPQGMSTQIDITLKPNTTHKIAVSVSGEVSCTTGNNTAFTWGYGGTDKDINGNPLVIVQGDVFQPPTNTPIPITPSPTSPLKISGYVREGSSTGPGIAGVTIKFALASYPVQPVTTTDANGFYSYQTDTQGHQENVSVVPEKAGYTFSPNGYYYISPSFGSNTAIDFVGTTGTLVPPTYTPTPTATTCALPTTVPMAMVDPVTSPTTATSQVVRVYAPGNIIKIVSEAGTFTTASTTSPADITVNLVPNSTNHLTVYMTVPLSGGTGCQYGGYTLSTSRDKNGNPLQIVQQSTVATTCQVTYTVSTDWPNSADRAFVANVVIKNIGTQSVAGWTLAWQYAGNQKITLLWNGRVNQTGQSVKVSNESWNGTIAPGATVSFGFIANYTGTNTNPTAFTLNGLPCK